MRRIAGPRRLLVGAAAVLASLLLGACGGTRSVHLSGRGGPVVPFGWRQGFNVTAYTPQGFSSPRALDALRRLKATGATEAVFVPVAYQQAKDSTVVDPDPDKTPDDQSILAGMRDARALGLRVALKPHIDVRDGTFRGDIQPFDRGAWYASYETLLLRYAALASAAKADLFVVGTELTSMQGDTARWKQLVAEVRTVFPGKLTYAANWQPGPGAVGFWPSLDFVGVDAYWPLDPGEQAPDLAALRGAWKGPIAELSAASKASGKPGLLTEIGYTDRQGTTQQPAVENTSAAVDDDAQARAYEAAYEAWRRVGSLAGLFWWEWPADPQARKPPSGYSPAGRPAEHVVRRYAQG